MMTLVFNSAELRSALDQANRTARLSEAQWKAVKGCMVTLEAAWRKDRRAVLRAELADSKLPGPLRSLIRARFEGTDFTDEELAAEILAAQQSAGI